MSVSVIGQGFVGGSLTTVLAERGEHVYVCDKAGIRAEGAALFFRDIAGLVSRSEADQTFSGFYFVCVPTPMKRDGSVDISIVKGIIEELARLVPSDRSRTFVIKSTIPPGTTESFNTSLTGECLSRIVFNPEFLTEMNALDDMRNQTRIIVGGPRPWSSRLKTFYQRVFPSIPIVKTSSMTAEFVKYMTNCFLATKVSFANEMKQICDRLDDRGLDIDYDKVVEYATMDPRLGTSHWSVPGHVPVDGKIVAGWGGHCFCKDLNGLMHLSRELGIDPTVMQAAWDKNLEVRPPEYRDWEKMVGRAVSEE